MSAPRSKSTKELLKAAKLPERTVSICLRGDLVADIEADERQLQEAVAERKNNGRVATKTDAKKIAERIDAKRAEMFEATVDFRLRAMKAADWRAMTGRHQTKDDGLDMLALMGEAIPASVIAPDDLDDDDWQHLNDILVASEMGKFIDAVWELNMQGVAVPKSRLASALNRTSDSD